MTYYKRWKKLARGNKDLAGFNDVASKNNINKNNNINNNNDIIENKNINVNDNVNNEGGEFIESLLGNEKKKDIRENVRGIYFDEDVVKPLDKLGKKGGRGAKSKIVNDALRFYFKSKGIIE